LGNNECFEPYTSNIYTRRVLSGEFVIVNKHLLRDLEMERVLESSGWSGGCLKDESQPLLFWALAPIKFCIFHQQMVI